MPTYSRAGQFGPALISGAPRGVPLRVVDAAGSDAVLYRDASKNVIAGPIVYSADSGEVTFFADPGTYTVKWAGGQASATITGGTASSPGLLTVGRGEPVGVPLAAGGETVCDRRATRSSVSTTGSGNIQLSYFVASATETINTLTLYSTGTAAATATLIRYCVYSVAANGDLTLAASTVNDLTLMAATNTPYPKTLPAPWNKVAGEKYAAGLLVVATTTPTLIACHAEGSGTFDAIFVQAPRLFGAIAGQADLANSYAAGSVGVSRRAPYVEMTP